MATLNLTRPTFAKLSPHPLLLATLSSESQPRRTNGRPPDHARPVHTHAQSLTHAHGSAVVRVGDTTVICGVRGEVLPVTSVPQYRPRAAYESTASSTSESERKKESARELRDYDLLVPNIELATGCAPQFLPGVPPTTLAQTLSTRVFELLHRCEVVDAGDLRVWYAPPKETGGDGDAMDRDDEEEDDGENPPELMAYWVLYIDLLFVSYDGNPFDAAWAALLAGLRNTKLPVARWDPDREMVVCSPSESRALNISGLPIACSAVVFREKEHGGGGKDAGRSWLLVDPDRLEENLCREMVTVVMDRSTGETRVRAIEKVGGTAIGPEMLREVVGIAEVRWQDFKAVMK